MSSKKNEKNEIILQKENEKIQNNLNKERKDNNKIFIGQKNLDFMNESSRGEIEEIKMQLIKEKDKNKKLEDKIKILERDLADEKNKNKKSDIIIVNLRKELDNEIKKYNDMIEQIEEDKIARKKLEKETKDSFLETIIEKEVITDNIQQNNNNNNQINNNNIIISNDIINNNEINNYKINNNNEKEIIKENNINNNIKRYKTQRVNKRKMNFRDFENDNLDIKDYDLTLSKNDIHYCEGSKSPESIKINANNIFSNKNNGIAPINNKNSSQSSEEISNKTLKVNINQNNIKDSQTYINLKSPNLYFTKRPENNSLSKKIKVDLKMNINIQQQKIMTKIREYYSNRKIQIEKKSTEKMVDCNVINLNLKNSKNNRQSSYSSPLSTFYSTTNSNFFSNKNNLREITSFGKTIGAFYTRKERYTRSRSLNSYEKK